MKNACIFHGSGGSPDDFWYPYVKNELEKIGYTVWVPQLPNPNNPDLKTQLPFVLNNHNYNEDTVLIGHSAGCPLILSLLESLDVKVKLSILVSGFINILPNGPKKILQNKYHWEKIKNNCYNFIFINSDNDPWGCDDKQGAEMAEHLGGELIVKYGEGHMGSEVYNQPYTKFPLIVELVETFEEKK